MKYSDALDRASILLQDVSNSTYSVDLVTQALNAALVAILPWVPRREIYRVPQDHTLGKSVSLVPLPSDFFRLIGVYDGAVGVGYFIPESAMLTSQRPASNQQSQNAYYRQADGIRFFVPVDPEKITVYYEAMWPRFTEQTVYEDGIDEVDIPAWSENAILFYTAYYCIISLAGNTGNMRQYNIQVDSGNPSHNPVRDMALEYHKSFLAECKLFPQEQRGQRN
jgi:hypothetical protein